MTPRAALIAFAREVGNADASLDFGPRSGQQIEAALDAFAARFLLTPPRQDRTDAMNAYTREYRHVRRGDGRRFDRTGVTRITCFLCQEQAELRDWSAASLVEHLLTVKHKLHVELRAVDKRAESRR